MAGSLAVPSSGYMSGVGYRDRWPDQNCTHRPTPLTANNGQAGPVITGEKLTWAIFR